MMKLVLSYYYEAAVEALEKGVAVEDLRAELCRCGSSIGRLQICFGAENAECEYRHEIRAGHAERGIERGSWLQRRSSDAQGIQNHTRRWQVL